MMKMTYAMALDVAINAVSDDAVVEKLTALKAQIEKKNSAERKPTKAQVANDALKGEMLVFLADAHTATEVAEQFGVSNQKASEAQGLFQGCGVSHTLTPKGQKCPKGRARAPLCNLHKMMWVFKLKFVLDFL